MINKQQKAGSNAQTYITVSKINYDDLGRVLTIKKLFTAASLIKQNRLLCKMNTMPWGN
ncbi:hypothetical protein [Paraflavitalea speifideaquila]|uniref:hypothetical protein n=1 Tax=Paraflavitalea speifideaquila TaxID=3076558 RepID=UPI0028E7F1E9|nr:hypothetical protein [Paraflavitalea speifideiaquila]